MKFHAVCFFLLCCLFGPLASAQRERLILKTPTNANVEMQKVWSDWLPNSGYPALQARFAKFEDNVITLELRNTGTTPLEGDFTANECPEQQKSVSGWKNARLDAGQSLKLSFATGNCQAGFHWWAQNVNVWSAWSPLNPDTYLSARWLRRSNELVLQVSNQGSKSVRADFTANFCESNSKSINGWQTVSIGTGETKSLSFKDKSPGQCNSGFHVWYKNLRGPQQIDDGTELVPAGN